MIHAKIYGLGWHLTPLRSLLSNVIHECVVEVLQNPKTQRSHRFITLDQGNFIYPDGRTNKYTITEFCMVEWQTVETKKKLIRLLFERIPKAIDITTLDLDFIILETPLFCPRDLYHMP